MNDFLLRVRFISKLRHYPLLIVQRIISPASIKYIRLLLKFILNLITSIFTSRFTSGEYIEKCFRGKKKKNLIIVQAKDCLQYEDIKRIIFFSPKSLLYKINKHSESKKQES